MFGVPIKFALVQRQRFLYSSGVRVPCGTASRVMTRLSHCYLWTPGPALTDPAIETALNVAFIKSELHKILPDNLSDQLMKTEPPTMVMPSFDSLITSIPRPVAECHPASAQFCFPHSQQNFLNRRISLYTVAFATLFTASTCTEPAIVPLS